MEVNLSTQISLPVDTVWKEVRTARLLMHVAWPLIRFVPVGIEPLDAFEPEGRYLVKLRLFGVLPIGTQWIATSIHEPEGGGWPKRLRDDGHSAIIKKWDHWITIKPNSQSGTDYRDEVDISAGLFTLPVWVFAQIFYRHRQRRWRNLARTFGARRLIDVEMTQYKAARAGGNAASAWRHLERAHIISQPFLALHLDNHWAMLGFAWAKRDISELAGQIARLALAPLGSLTGRIPIGNTGRSNVSAFKPMPLPDDLHRLIEDASR